MAERVKDIRWIRQSFMLPEDAIESQDMVRRVLTTASYKFTDTTLGGNFAINAPPQFCRNADIKVGGNSDIVFQRASGRFLGKDKAKASNPSRSVSFSRGQGRYYSEAIDDNGQFVVMRFGQPEFNSLTKFFGGFYDPAMAALARTGRGESLLYSAGKAAGFLLALPFQPFILGGKIIRFFGEFPTTKFYYMKPAMPLYWNAVNAMVNGIAVNMGIVPRVLTPEQSKVYDNPSKYGPGNYADYHKFLPDVISPQGAIDVYAVATRAQRLSHNTNIELRKRLDNAIDAERARQEMSAYQVESMKLPPSQGIEKYVQAYANIATNRPPKTVKDADSVESADDRKRYDGVGTGSGSWGSNFAEFFEGERRDGAQFITLRVDYSGPASESFSNSTKESEIAQKINSMSSTTRSTRFNFANGNLGDGVISSTIEGIGSAIKDTALGIADGLQIEGLVAGLAGSAFVDIPKMWDQSIANLPRMDYTMELRSPYGNKYSRLQNLYVPLSMLLAGALPLSTGARSYNAPFLVEAYCRGRAAIRMGMIDTISITRGVGNMGWTQDGEPLGIDVSFSIVDLSSIMHMPIAPAFKTSTALASLAQAVGGDVAAGAIATLSGSTYDEDNAYTDYLGVLGSLSFQDMVYVSNKWRLNLTKQLRTFESWRSPARMANWFFGTTPGRIISAVALGTDRTQ